MKYILLIFNVRFLKASFIAVTLLALTFILKTIIDIKPSQTLV
jgi:hypothetical protein